MPAEARHISVSGVVQGVGFRPFVYNLAVAMGLAGWVLNNSAGVEIEVEGPPAVLDAFVAALAGQAPPLARIESLHSRPIAPQGFAGFEIRHSERQEGCYQLISPDVATCPDCRRELLDPADRRYRYPFTNCTNCGPRFTIIADIPYDRPNTTMRVFPMCPDCQREYGDPTNRRFHAQPNACPACGPHVWLTDAAGRPLVGDERRADNDGVFEEARRRLLAGQILAVKGLGGFLLACDATNAAAVRMLRERKRRPHKPFAIMVATLDDARTLCHISPQEEALLTSVQCPIVLLDTRPAGPVATDVAPNSHTLGVMLPYTPLHHVLLRDAGRPLVMTSGNLTEEPIACDNAEALRRLAGLADAFLLHDRDIYSRYDDSVWQVIRMVAPGGSNRSNGCEADLRRLEQPMHRSEQPAQAGFANVAATSSRLEEAVDHNPTLREMLAPGGLNRSNGCEADLRRLEQPMHRSEQPAQAGFANVAATSSRLEEAMDHNPTLREMLAPGGSNRGNGCEADLRRLGQPAQAGFANVAATSSRPEEAVGRSPTLQEIAQPARRARGYAPFPVRLPFRVEPTLAAGADLKNAFCLARDEYAFVSQHIGDMENLETLEQWESTLALYRHLFRLEPARVACDLHPDYLSTRAAAGFARRAGLPAPIPIQHHRAHIAACLADNDWPLDAGPVIGVALDGTGYGDDGAIWGGEWLVGDYGDLRRTAHLEYLPLPGGDAATRHPARIAAGYLYALREELSAEFASEDANSAGDAGRSASEDAPLLMARTPAGLLPAHVQTALFRQIDRRLNTPMTSSMGRLFDAVSTLLGVCRDVTYEAQAAIELEQVAAAPAGPLPAAYPFELEEGAEALVVRLGPLLAALLDEIRRGAAPAQIALRFHVTVARMIEQVCGRLRQAAGTDVVALSGGCFQNRLLTGLAVSMLEGAGFRVLMHRQVPPNDGGLALGQAVLAHLE